MIAVSQGRLGESLFLIECIKRDIPIYQTIVDDRGVDFVVGDKQLFKIQVKTTSITKSKRPGTYQINCRKGFNSRAYTNEFDYLVAVILPLDLTYIIPISLLNKTTIGINPHNPNCKFNRYKEAWELLTQGASRNHP